jgi:predicted  nucleic acid-binding Zn-ribbon protein
LEALEELARIDLGYRQLDVELQEITTRLAELRGDVDRMRDLLQREKTQLAEAETLRTQTVREIEDIAERMTRSSKRQQVAKNAREIEATTRELEVLKREREERSAKAQELERVVGQVRESLARHEVDFARLQEVLAAEEGAVTEKTRQIDTRRLEQDEARKDTASKIRADILRKYNTIRERKVPAVAQVIGGICRGCHIALPPQLFQQLHAGKQLFQCPNCQRILLLRGATAGG